MPEHTDHTLQNAEPIAVGLDPLISAVNQALEDLKAKDIVTLPISDISTIADAMIVATATSTTHVKSLAEEVAMRSKEAGYRPIGTEGMNAAEWVLVDIGDIIVHIMLPETREFYDLERLWTARPMS